MFPWLTIFPDSHVYLFRFARPGTLSCQHKPFFWRSFAQRCPQQLYAHLAKKVSLQVGRLAQEGCKATLTSCGRMRAFECVVTVCRSLTTSAGYIFLPARVACVIIQRCYLSDRYVARSCLRSHTVVMGLPSSSGVSCQPNGKQAVAKLQEVDCIGRTQTRRIAKGQKH